MEQQARASVRAHQGQREEAGALDEARQGDRRADGQQGACAERRDEGIVLVRIAVAIEFPFELALEQRRPDEGAAVPAGQAPRDRRALENEQAAAPARRLPPEVAVAQPAMAMLAPE